MDLREFTILYFLVLRSWLDAALSQITSKTLKPVTKCLILDRLLMSLTRYFEAHLAVKTEQVKQSLHSSDGGAVVAQQPFYKVPRA